MFEHLYNKLFSSHTHKNQTTFSYLVSEQPSHLRRKVKVEWIKHIKTTYSLTPTPTQMNHELNILTLRDHIQSMNHFLLMDQNHLYDILYRLNLYKKSAKFTFEEISRLFECPIDTIYKQLSCRRLDSGIIVNRSNREVVHINSFELIRLFQRNVTTMNLLQKIYKSGKWFEL